MPLVKEFDSAIRGFHFYKRYWNPTPQEELFCHHEEENAFDVFAIKTTNKDGVIRGHLPREISRVTKFLLDRGARMTAILTSVNYRRSPLVQGGLEIPCRVKITMANTKKCDQILDRYLDLISTLYTEPNPPLILCSILGDDLVMAEYPESVKKTERIKISKPKETSRSMDIRKFFLAQGSNPPEKKKRKENDVIVLE